MTAPDVAAIARGFRAIRWSAAVATAACALLAYQGFIIGDRYSVPGACVFAVFALDGLRGCYVVVRSAVRAHILGGEG